MSASAYHPIRPLLTNTDACVIDDTRITIYSTVTPAQPLWRYQKRGTMTPASLSNQPDVPPMALQSCGTQRRRIRLSLPRTPGSRKHPIDSTLARC